MNNEFYTNSIQLDQIIVEKLKNSTKTSELQTMTNPELINEINSLKYLLYIINQDRMTLRHNLLRISSRVQSLSERDSIQKLDENDIEGLTYHLGLYEATGNSSEICTVVNTSLLPYSCENTEREFSSFTVSPQISPRFPMETVLTPFQSTEVTTNKNSNKCVKPPVIPSEISEDSFSSSQDNLLDCSNYLMQHNGDDDVYPSNTSSSCNSRKNSI
ncbi:hypothetical protein SteCoe_13476 [Stentor coeruleus]|uniref:Uncharacterized protein n=1 Tax=Stentor coeruleus TaxID=5963 RepID=A0A1R2C8E4_9CILI|nr:hypothetical protein SteCoe_13476 [Stentor coeruleus]